MHKISTAIAATLVALSASAFAQDNLPPAGSDPAREQRMNEAYQAHHESKSGGAGATVRSDARQAGHAFHQGVRATGHAIHKGVKATGHAIHQGVKATGHAIHEGVDKVTGKD
jgi:uncharacterized protein YfaQ (DUF2300 family)